MSQKTRIKDALSGGKIPRLWDSLSHIGIYDGMDGREYSKVKFINQIMLFTIVLDIIIFISFLLFVKEPGLQFFTSFISFIFKLPIFILHYYRHYTLTKSYLVITFSSFVGFMSIYGGSISQGVEYSYPLYIVFISMFFDKKRDIFLHYAWLLFTYIFSKLYINAYGTIQPVLLTENEGKVHDMVFVLCMVILAGITKWYLDEFSAYNRKTEALNKKLLARNKDLEQFTYITSHDLQEPLQTISVYSSLLKKRYDNQFDEVGDKALMYINNSSTRMQDLIKALLDYSRIGKTVTIKEVDCKGLIAEIVSDNQVSIDSANAKIEYWGLPQIKGYEIELKLLFQNLISNAIKYRNDSQKSPQIQISADEEKAFWQFKVKDNGIGIADKNKDKIFEVFQRLHSVDEFEGTGIGLSHCKKIVEAHEGDIWVESTVNEGSTFYFTISKNLS